MIEKVSIVLGLGFGDEGKGLTVNHLCQNGKSIVVRFSGGQQAGHTVDLHGVKHVCSNFGAGVLKGCPTYFTEHCTMYLNTLHREYDILTKVKGVLGPRVIYHPLTKVTTPYDIAFNRMMSSEQGKTNTCGLGIGTTMHRHVSGGHKLHVMDLINPSFAKEKLRKIKEWYGDFISGDNPYYKLLAEEEEIFFKHLESFTDDNWIDVYTYGWMDNRYEHVIFEGSQGILLDMDHGVFPDVTYANTTSKNALEVCNKLNTYPIPLCTSIYYVTRCYLTRHGDGWMPNEDEVTLINNERETNVLNSYQGKFRTGELDYGLIQYAIEVDKIYSENIDLHNRNLVITCLDQRPDFKLSSSLEYQFGLGSILGSYSPQSDLKLIAID